MEASVESICNLLVRSRLMAPSGVRGLHQKWKDHAKDNASDVHRFGKWLVANNIVTDYQCGLLMRGKVDHFFLNDYKILDRLGQGRMAGIFQGMHSLGQIVAIKVLPPSKVKDPETFGRFQREARLAIKLKHPNVVRTFQMGLSDGLHYIVMEYLDGDTLEEVLQRRKMLPPAESARIIHQALLGLQHIQEQGMVHRDLKPANLMLVPSPPKGQPDTTLHATVKILDIGLGRALFDEGAPGGPENVDLTGTGAMLGTPEYLAPEQARNAHAADIRADIYSLGCVLYHCLGGKPPFQDANPVLQMVKHATEPARRLKELNPAVPDGLQQIVDWMMAKDPAQRYPTPERAAQALQVFLAAGQDGQRPPELNAQMQAYLKWLEVNGPDSGPMAAMPTPAAAPAPAPRSAPAAVRSTPNPIPVPTPPGLSGPIPAMVSNRSPGVALAEPMAEPMGDVELMPLGQSQPQTAASAERSGLGSREFLLLGLGLGLGGGMVVLVGIMGWLLIRWIAK